MLVHPRLHDEAGPQSDHWDEQCRCEKNEAVLNEDRDAKGNEAVDRKSDRSGLQPGKDVVREVAAG